MIRQVKILMWYEIPDDDPNWNYPTMGQAETYMKKQIEDICSQDEGYGGIRVDVQDYARENEELARKTLENLCGVNDEDFE